MSQTNQRKTPTSAHNRPNRGNPRPNPEHQLRRPEPTYRARSVTSGYARPAKATQAVAAPAKSRAASSRGRRVRRILLVLLLVALAAGGGASYFLFKSTIEPVLRLPGDISKPPVDVRVVDPDGTVSPDSTPHLVVVEPPDWESDEPVNILLLGLDYRPLEEDTRADTQIIVHIDPAAKTATMFSIPRDLYVTIPGFGMGRINQSYQMGDRAERLDPGSLPGGGPTLAMSTISATFGIPIHYYAEVNFQGFERVVDAMGGLKIDVPAPLVDNEYPLASRSYGATRIYVPAGVQHMDGKSALQYARSRHADSDLGRNQRQQQVLLALKQQGMNINILPRLGELAGKLSGAVQTDIPLDQIPSLAKLAQEIGPGNITTCGIDATMVEQTILASGADVLMPIWERIRPRVKQCFSDPRLVNENARLSVQNGTTVGGTARKVSEMLGENGLNVADLSSAADQGQHPRTTITDYTGGQKPHTLDVIKQTLGLTDASVVRGDPADAPIAVNLDGLPVDILVMVGDDRLNQQPARTPTRTR
ncbi:MAG: LCP family protein [Chloroflexota bacterium]|nr:LCP family protein [Chloroflexota bacterium]MDQ5865864.1 LCP family protein [Chloroflexota bacterium]